MPDITAPENPGCIDLRNVTPESADLYIYGAIPAPGEIAWLLAGLRDLKVATLNVRINSGGGSAMGGQAIYNVLNDLAASIVVYVDGLAASAASVIAMAGDQIIMAQNSAFVIHCPSGVAEGGSDDMRQTAEMMDQIASAMADTYSKRTGVQKDRVLEMMNAETWLYAADALALGFCTSITPAKEITASFDLSAFKKVPASFMAKPKEAGATPAVTAAVVTDAAAVVAPVVETFTAEIVQDKIRAAVDAANAKAKIETDRLTAEIVRIKADSARETDRIKAEHARAIDEISAKLKDAEAMSAAHIGAQPIAHVVTDANAKAPTGDAEILAHYRTLAGDPRSEYFAKHNAAIWRAYEAEASQAPAR